MGNTFKGRVNWLVKDQEAYGYWVFDEFRAVSERNQVN
jgi:hypothetical protein